MATKKVTKVKARNERVKPASESASNGGSTITVAKATVTRGNGDHGSVYEDGVKEIVALSENETYARKIDNGPLAEARGKDTWRLHAQLRAVDQMNIHLSKSTSALRTALAELDDHLHTDTVAVTQLVQRHGDEISEAVAETRSAVEGWFGATQEQLSGAVSRAQTNVNKNVKESSAEIESRLDKLQESVRSSFAKLSAATAGTEENLRGQTQAFSKEVEQLMGSLRDEFDNKITQFRDEATRLIDKRFNQADVAFAAVRADQEVIKALLTDIIKDRMGRPEPKVR